MSHGQGKPQNGQGNVREKSGDFVRAHGWTPWISLYSPVQIWHGPIYQDITYGTAMTAAERKSNFKLTIATPYLTLTGELWGVYYEDFEENYCQVSNIRRTLVGN